MLLTFTEESVNLTFQKDYLSQRDNDYYQKGSIEVFIYGYPYSLATEKYLSAKEVYEIYLESGQTRSFLKEIDGVFGIVILNKVTNENMIIVDPYKIYSFYIVKSENKIMVSDSIDRLKGQLANLTLNESGVKELVNFGFMLGNKTMFQEIETLSCGTVLTMKNLNIEEEIYFGFNKNETTYTKEEYLQAFNDNVAKGLKLGNKISLPLTGGLDSRTILSACKNEKEKLHCYTHGLKNSDDVTIAKKLCNTLHLQHTHYEKLGKSFIESIPEAATKLTNIHQGMINSFMFSHIKNSYEKESKVCDSFFTGVGGEMVRLYYLPKNFSELTVKELAVELRKKIQFKPYFDIFKDTNTEESLNELVLQEIEKYNSEDPVYIIEKFYLQNAIGNFASYNIRLIGKYMNVFNPFLSKELLKVIPTISMEHKANNSSQKHVIKSNSPDLIEIPMDRGRKINDNKSYSYKGNIKYLLFRGKKFINNKFKKTIFKINFVDYNTWLSKHHLNFIKAQLSYSDLNSRVFLDQDKVENKIRDYINGDSRSTYQITNLISLELFLKRIGYKK